MEANEKDTKFTDSHGRPWECRITYRHMRALESEGLPLKDIEQHLQALVMGDSQVFDWLWAVLAEQAKTHSVDRDTFNDVMFESVGDAVRCFCAAVENFFQRLNPNRANLFRESIETANREIENGIADLKAGKIGADSGSQASESPAP